MTAVLVLIGTLIGAAGTLVAAYFQQKWSGAATIASEERQARRAERREAAAPVLRFLDTAGKVAAARFFNDSIDLVYDMAATEVTSKWSRDEFTKLFLSSVKMVPTPLQMEHDCYEAAAAAPTREMIWSLLTIWAWTVAPEEEASLDKVRQAIRHARSQIEDYIVKGLPAGPPPQFDPTDWPTSRSWLAGIKETSGSPST